MESKHLATSAISGQASTRMDVVENKQSLLDTRQKLLEDQISKVLSNQEEMKAMFTSFFGVKQGGSGSGTSRFDLLNNMIEVDMLVPCNPNNDKGKAKANEIVDVSNESTELDPFNMDNCELGSPILMTTHVDPMKEGQADPGEETLNILIEKETSLVLDANAEDGGTAIVVEKPALALTAKMPAVPKVRAAPSSQGNKNSQKLITFNVLGTFVDSCLLRGETAIKNPTVKTGSLTILFRPWLLKFLENCFKHFTVAFWEFSKKEYVEDIVSTILCRVRRPPSTPPLFVWRRESVCSLLKTPDGKPGAWEKPLKWVFHVHPKWNHSNIVLVDANSEKVEVNPPKNLIVPPQFYANRVIKLSDDMDYLKSSLWPLLQELKSSTSMEDFLSCYPQHRQLDEKSMALRYEEVMQDGKLKTLGYQVKVMEPSH